MKRFPTVAFALAIAATASAQQIPTPGAISQIREEDLRRDLFFLASDAMRGREAGTIDELRASGWIADEMRRIGILPLGEDGTYFQWFNMRRTRLSTVSSSVKIGARELAFWTEVTPTSNAAGDVSAATAWVRNINDSTQDIRGKVAVAMLNTTEPTGRQTTTNSWEYRWARAAITAQGNALRDRGAAAVILVADSIGESAYEAVCKLQTRGTYDVPGSIPRLTAGMLAGGTGRGGAAGRGAAGGAGGRGGRGGFGGAQIPVLFVHRSMGSALRADGQIVEIHIRSESFESPSVNIIGVVRGTEARLRDEYVMFSSHQDHDGVRFTYQGDSIWNGADDNGSTSVALLAIARAWVKQPSKRSAIFIYQGAEERGLLGSRYAASHPPVALDRIVAVLNGDMIGRNSPDTAALLGTQPPHRNSTPLVDMALEANTRQTKFVVDSSWDRPTHVEGWYFRSDHASWAEVGVPALFFSTNLHDDYHTVRDNPDRINYPKLTKMAQWMYLTGWIAANTEKRPAIDPDFKVTRNPTP